MKKLTLLLCSFSISAEKRQKLSFITRLVQKGAAPRGWGYWSQRGELFVVMRIGGRAGANSGTRNAKDNAEIRPVAE